jgi:hypothetical protein
MLLCTGLAFAGPQISVSDPDCTHSGSEIQLTTNNFSFTLGSQTTITFCNATQDTWQSLNFTVQLGSNIDLAGIYCGGPSDLPHSAFDYCMVLDPSQPIEGTEPKYGNEINSFLVHEFSAVPDGDKPTDFYNTPNRCFYGCALKSDGSPGTQITNVIGSVVQFSFNLRPQLTFASVNANEPNAPNGLLPNEQFTLSFDCSVSSGGCDPWSGNTVFSFVASTSPNTTDFPTTVPEPATLVLMASAGIPAFLRRRKKL